MASTTVRGVINQNTIVAIADVVATAADGYIVTVHNPTFTHVGFSITSTGITADGADSVLWLQGLVLDYDMNIAVDNADADDQGACLLSTANQVAMGNATGWEAITSGGAGAITVNIATWLYTQGMLITHKFLGHGFALKIRGDTGADSWTTGDLKVVPLASGGY